MKVSLFSLTVFGLLLPSCRSFTTLFFWFFVFFERFSLTIWVVFILPITFQNPLFWGVFCFSFLSLLEPLLNSSRLDDILSP